MAGRSISRRNLLAGSASLVGAGVLRHVNDAFASPSGGVKLTDDRRRSLLAALVEADQSYDPAVKMLRHGASDIGYHTTISTGYVHPTRNSLTYAVALLDSGDPERFRRATEILRTVIPLQDQNPEHRTYGIWSWYLEEPLEKMSPPDWNWADFCGVQLLAVWLDHRDRLDEQLRNQVREAIIHAARSIKRRNVGPGYTNIAIMGTYVSLVVGEQFDLAEIRTYAKERLRRFYRYTMDQGSFSEYNSPTYSIVALKELSRMLGHVRDPDDRRLIGVIHDLAWKHVASHFHPPTRQWAGPHSRCYSTDLRKRESYLAFLDAATRRRAGLIKKDPLPLGLDTYRLPIQCPEKYIELFTELNEPRKVTETFLKADPNRRGRNSPTKGTTYLHPKYTLGTVNMGDCWIQRRPFLAYWGAPDRPTYLRVRFLHDHYDFCSALLFSMQNEGCVLTALVFATDYGDTHPSLNKVKKATIEAEDLRLRFEFGAEIDGLRITQPASPGREYQIEHRGVRIALQPLSDAFGKTRFQWQTGRNDNTAWIDAVAWSGKRKPINLAELHKAYLAFALSVRTEPEKPVPVASASVSLEGERLHASWATRKYGTFHFTLPAKPGKRNELRDAYFTLVKM